MAVGLRRPARLGPRYAVLLPGDRGEGQYQLRWHWLREDGSRSAGSSSRTPQGDCTGADRSRRRVIRAALWSIPRRGIERAPAYLRRPHGDASAWRPAQDLLGGRVRLLSAVTADAARR